MPGFEQVDYHAPAKWRVTGAVLVKDDLAVVGNELDYTVEGYLGTQIRNMMSRWRRKIASNEEKYRMRAQAATLLAHLFDEKSQYINLSLLVHAASAPYLQAMTTVFQVLGGKTTIDPLAIPITNALPSETLSAEAVRQIEMAGATDVYFLHTSSPVAICLKPMVLRRVEGRWVITNAVVFSTDTLRGEWIDLLRRRELSGQNLPPVYDPDLLGGLQDLKVGLEFFIASRLGLFD